MYLSPIKRLPCSTVGISRNSWTSQRQSATDIIVQGDIHRSPHALCTHRLVYEAKAHPHGRIEEKNKTATRSTYIGSQAQGSANALKGARPPIEPPVA